MTDEQQEPFTGTAPPADPGPAFPEWAADTPIPDAIAQVIGAASMCWENPEAAGDYDADAAERIAAELLAFLQMKLWAP